MRIVPFRFLCIFSFFLAASLCVSPARSRQPSPDEKFLLDAANRERAERGTPPLRWDSALALAAGQHAREMVRHNSISHRFAGEAELKARVKDAGARFSQVAENVAQAPDVASIHINWMLSPGHSANILNPQLDSIGISVERRGDEYFAVQDFSASVAALTREEQEKEVAALLTARGLRIVTSSEDARKACAHGGAGGAHPRAFAHFDSPDLRQLPDGLVKMIRSGDYSSAEVGACDPGDQGGFSTFRIAVLFF
jgi:hypothetical protein